MSGFFLTRDEVLNFPAEAYKNVATISRAISQKYSCGISDETARKIIEDYKALCQIGS